MAIHTKVMLQIRYTILRQGEQLIIVSTAKQRYQIYFDNAAVKLAKGIFGVHKASRVIYCEH